MPEPNAENPPLTPEQGEADWEELLTLMRDVVAIRHLEADETVALRTGHFGDAPERMLSICLMKKRRLVKRIAVLIDRVVDNPCWGEPPAPRPERSRRDG